MRVLWKRSIQLGFAALTLAAAADSGLAQTSSQQQRRYPAPTYNQNTFGTDWAKPRQNNGSFYNDPRQSPVRGPSGTLRCAPPLFYDTVSGSCR
ncbi:MAG: hypothetical protein AB1490_28015 [Pseudomonadota bacterium]